MPSRTYKEEEVGPQSTNRFVVPREIPTTVVTGAETKLASVQPNLTGKRKLPYQPDDIAEEPDVGEVNSLGEWITAIAGGLSLGMWVSETGLLGKGAQEASSNLLKSGAANINSLLGTQTGPLRDINRNEFGRTPYQERQRVLAKDRTEKRKAPARPIRISETKAQPKLPPGPPINLAPDLRASKNNRQEVNLQDNSVDAVGATPSTDDLGPGHGDTEATWGG